MHNKILLGALCALALGGCAHHQGRVQKLEVRQNPQVTVEGGMIKVPEVIYFFKGETNVPITWQLPPGLTFPENGIEIEGALTDRVIKGNGTAVILDPSQTEIQCDKQRGGQTF